MAKLRAFIAVLAVLSSLMKPEPTQTFSQLLRLVRRELRRDEVRAE